MEFSSDIMDFEQFAAGQRTSFDQSKSMEKPTAGQGKPTSKKTRKLAATRRSRTRKWPPKSDFPHRRLPSLQAHIAQHEHKLLHIGTGLDSGRNLMAVFEDCEDGEPRLAFNVHCGKGRNKKDWPQFKSVKEANLPIGATLKDICQYYPLHVWKDGLRIFLAEDWTAEQIWLTLPSEARHEGAETRPWNYLQQALGREGDDMYTEAGQGKRVPIKRKKVDTTEVEVAKSHDFAFPAHSDAIRELDAFNTNTQLIHNFRNVTSGDFLHQNSVSADLPTLHVNGISHQQRLTPFSGQMLHTQSQETSQLNQYPMPATVQATPANLFHNASQLFHPATQHSLNHSTLWQPNDGEQRRHQPAPNIFSPWLYEQNFNTDTFDETPLEFNQMVIQKSPILESDRLYLNTQPQHADYRETTQPALDPRLEIDRGIPQSSDPNLAASTLQSKQSNPST